MLRRKKFRRKPEKVSDIFGKLFKSLGLEDTVIKHEAMLVWNEVVGEKIASVTKPQKLEYGRLYIEVSNSAWKNELHYFKKDFITKINAKIKKNMVKEIIFV